MPKPSTIAIDGPAGSGKTTVGAALAERLGYTFFDTGVVYRAATLAALRAGVSVTDEQAVIQVVEGMSLQVGPPHVHDGRTSTVTLDGEDVTWALRSREVDEGVSPVSAHPGVRERLRDLQRSVAAQGRVVVVGRDIGTVILPDADLKVYLDASRKRGPAADTSRPWPGAATSLTSRCWRTSVPGTALIPGAQWLRCAGRTMRTTWTALGSAPRMS